MNLTTKCVWILIGSFISASAITVIASPPQMDQFQNHYGGGGYVWVDREIAQTFTPAVSGWLDSIDVYPDWWQGPACSLQVRITGTANGKPDTTAVLGGAMVPTSTSNWTNVPLTSGNIWLNAGTLYAMWFTSDDPSVADPGIGVGVNWSPDLYNRGVALKRLPGEDWTPWSLDGGPSSTTDVCFRTYMVVPEPRSVMVIGAAMVGGGSFARRRQRAARHGVPIPRDATARRGSPSLSSRG